MNLAALECVDYVIIDAPPLGIFTDATVLINQADGAMIDKYHPPLGPGVVDRFAYSKKVSDEDVGEVALASDVFAQVQSASRFSSVPMKPPDWRRQSPA